MFICLVRGARETTLNVIDIGHSAFMESTIKWRTQTNKKANKSRNKIISD